MRQIVLDTETTGLDPASGHRIIEIGCVEIMNRRLSGRHYHQYINPAREIDAGAIEVHGLTEEFLSAKPLFADIAQEFLDFVRGAELVIHNAPFDVGFIDSEFKQAGAQFGVIADHCQVFDTLPYAREMHPGQRNSLDALCRRYEVDNAHRDLHGALLDAELLADVYLAMTGGQVDLQLAADSIRASEDDKHANAVPVSYADIAVVELGPEESNAHRQYLERLDAEAQDGCIWLKQSNEGA